MLLLTVLCLLVRPPLQAQDENKPRGANVDESLVQTTIYVDAASGNDETGNPYRTFGAALAQAKTNLTAGTPTKVILKPGVYREGNLDTGTDPALLVVEGEVKGSVIISGSDVVPFSEWTNEGGGVYSIPWDKDWYFHDGNWGANGPRNLLGHRKEMIFVNGELLEQVMLEDWTYTYKTTIGEGKGSWSYNSYLGTSVLQNGSFGVSDKSHGAGLGKLFVKFPAGVDPATAKIEVATRTTGLKVRKSNVVVRNLVVEHFANKTDRNDSEIPFILQTQNYFNWREEYAIKNALLEDCEFRWNNGTGYNLTGNINVTLRQIFAHHNGGNGCTSAYTAFSVWENLEASNNNWRVSGYGGKDSWYVAGHKLGWCAKYMTIRGYKTFDNAGAGLWTDGNSYYMDFSELESKGNKCGLFVEISSGPTKIENSHFYDNREEGILIVEARNTTIRNCIIENNEHAQVMPEITDRPRVNTYPAEFTGGTSVKDADGKVLHETKGVYAYNNIIRTNKGATSYLMYPSLQYSSRPDIYESFLNNEYKADSNTYYNSDNAAMFVLSKTEFGNLNQWKERLRGIYTDKPTDQEVHSTWAGYLPTPPATPAELAATASTTGQIGLTWTDRSDTEQGFIIQRKVDNNAFVTIDSVAANVKTFTDSGLRSDTSYIYRVYSFNADGNSFNASNEAAALASVSPLPSQWLTTDVGEVLSAGNASYIDGEFIVNASGIDIYGTYDEFHYVYQSLNGDGEIIARVKSMTNSHPYVKAGVMMRATLDNTSANVAVTGSFRNLVEVTRRLTTGGATVGTSADAPLPRWVKLVRSGNTFTGYESPDGITWTKVEEVIVQMPAQIYVGLAVTSHQDGLINTTRFDNVSFTPAAPSPPFAPVNFSGTYNPETVQIELAWTDNANNEAGFRLERKVLGGNYSLLTTLSPDVVTFIDSSVVNGQVYVYRLQAFNELGEATALEDTVASKLLGDRVLLTTPAAKEVRRTKSTNVLETGDRNSNFWAGRLAPGVVGTAVYPFKLPPLGADQTIATASFKVRIEGITPDQNVITDLWGLAYRNEDFVQTGDYFDGVYEGANQGTATLVQSNFARGGSITLNEQRTTSTAGNENLAAFLNAQYANGATGGEWVFIRINCNSAQENNRILFDHAADEDGFKPEIKITIVDKTAPVVPSNVTAIPVSPTAIRLTWQDNAFNESGYVLERKSADAAFVLLDSLAAGVNSYLDSTVAYGTTYQYRLYAYNVYGQSAYSDTLTTSSTLNATLSPVHDSGIMEEYPGANIGSNSGISTFKQNNGKARIGYAKFSLAGIDVSKVDSVVFQLRATEIYGSAPVRVAGYKDSLSGENWTENALNWNNRFAVDTSGSFITAEVDPLGGTAADGAVMSKADSTFTLSNAALAAFLRSQTAADQSVTFMFRADGGLVTFASKENNTVEGPTLQIFYKESVTTPPTVVLPLTLTSVCSSDPAVSRRWRIRNENSFAVSVNWSVYGTTQSGTMMAPAGDSYFLTNTVANSSNTTIISWVDEAGIARQNTKASSEASCSAKEAGAEDAVKLELAIQAAPNPAVTHFTLTIPATTEKQAHVLITNSVGTAVYQTEHALQEGVNQLTIRTDGMKGLQVVRVVVGKRQATKRILVIR